MALHIRKYPIPDPIWKCFQDWECEIITNQSFADWLNHTTFVETKY